MKSLYHHLITASVLLGLSGFSLAQTAPEQSSSTHRAERMEKMHAKKGARHTEHLADLKGKLKLETSQESAWLVFEQGMQKKHAGTDHPDRAALAKMTTPERIDRMEAHQAQRSAQMKKQAEAVKSFYATLNTQQKSIFDSETARVMPSMGGHMSGQMGKGKSHKGHHDHH